MRYDGASNGRNLRLIPLTRKVFGSAMTIYCVPNPGPRQEYQGEDDELPVTSDTSSLKSVTGLLKVPSGPGFGITIDPTFLARPTPVRV